MARRKKRVEHDNHDRWLISYADFLTLLFAFFVVMYSISSINEEKYRTFSAALTTALKADPSELSAPPQTTTPIPPEKLPDIDPEIIRLGQEQLAIQQHMNGLEKSLTQVMSPLINDEQVSINQTKRGILIDISANMLFQIGSATLQPATYLTLAQIAEVLREEDTYIEIEGHTDNTPIDTPLFPSNWELSSARASSIARMLILSGIEAQRLAVVGLADNQPLAPNDNEANRSKNRRVTIVVLSPNVQREDGEFLPTTP